MRTLIAAGGVASVAMILGLSLAMTVTDTDGQVDHPAVVSNAADVLFATEWSAMNPDQRGNVCDTLSADREWFGRTWANGGANPAAVAELYSLIDSQCSRKA